MWFFKGEREGVLMKLELTWVGVFENLKDIVGSFWGEKTLNEGA